MKRLVTGLLLFSLLGACKKEKNRICEIYETPNGYEIGTIDRYVTLIGKVNYHYSYNVDGVTHKGTRKAYGIGQKDDRLLGRTYLVIYNLSDPSESVININYPVDSDSTLMELRNEFAINPPEPSWPKCK
jgi:hypothetical protein